MVTGIVRLLFIMRFAPAPADQVLSPPPDCLYTFTQRSCRIIRLITCRAINFFGLSSRQNGRSNRTARDLMISFLYAVDGAEDTKGRSLAAIGLELFEERRDQPSVLLGRLHAGGRRQVI